MHANVSLWSFIADAGLLVKTVLLILFCASIFSWSLILQRLSLLKQLKQSMRTFEKTFWSGVNLNELFERLKLHKATLEGYESIFYSGFLEFNRLYQKNADPTKVMITTERAMDIAIEREINRLENKLTYLATIGSTSPYVGLFGTVWGIMTSFRSLAHVQQATIAMVAPGISEALIATAVGLFAAIPATIAYNYFTNQLEHIERYYDMFGKEFANFLYRKMAVTTATPGE